MWEAWSRLYLDTELSPAMHDATARTLAASPYTAAELRTILWEEVHPACWTNLAAVAGEWAFFDEDALAARILARRRATLPWPTWLLPGRRAMRAEAEAMLAAVARARG